MCHILKAEIEKLFRSRSFMICSIIIVIMSLIVLASYQMMTKIYTPEFIDQLNEQMAAQSGASVEASADLDFEFLNNLSGISMVEMSFTGNTIQLILAVLVSIFVCSEFTGGAIKSIASRGFSRTKIYTAKYLVSILAGEILAIISILVLFLGGTILWGVGETGADFGKHLAAFFAIEFLLNAAVAGMMVFVAMMVRNMGGTIAINVCVLMFSGMIFSLIDLVLKLEEVKIADYWIYNIIANITSVSMNSDLINRSLIAGIFILAVSYVAGAVQFKLADIK